MEIYDVVVERIAPLAEDVLGLDFRRAGGQPFPNLVPGGHALVRLPSGLERSYSFVNAPAETRFVSIAVQLARDSRGGSKEMFSLRRGDAARLSLPATTFGLGSESSHHVLLAAGIGITPAWSMIQQLEVTRQSWELHYGARSPERAAFAAELRALERRSPDRVHLALSSEGNRLDIGAIVVAAGPSAEFYCCGPHDFIQDFRHAASDRGERAHLEDFTPADTAEGGFDIELARSGLKLWVPTGSTILDAVLAAGVDADYSCKDGTCGSCEVDVLSGEPSHRDHVLTDEEHESNATMMICCSGRRSGQLVIDL